MSEEEKKSLISKIKESFSNQEPKHIYVEEWDQDIYMTPLTLDEQDKINARSKGSPYQLAVFALITKAQDEKGNSLFTIADKTDLLHNVSFSTVEKIITTIYSSDGGSSAGEAEKN